MEQGKLQRDLVTRSCITDCPYGLTATTYDQFGDGMRDIVITWTSVNGTVDPASATTGADGTVTTTFAGVEAGTTAVIAINGTVCGTAAVTVSEVPLDNMLVTASGYNAGSAMVPGSEAVEYDSADTNHDCVVSMMGLRTSIGRWKSGVGVYL